MLAATDGNVRVHARKVGEAGCIGFAVAFSDAALGVHARKVVEAGCITCTNGYEGRVPRTEYALTPVGGRPWINIPIIWE